MQQNREKVSKWHDYQPILHPTSADFNERIVCFDGEYLANSSGDEEAINLIRLLKLDDHELAIERHCYLENLKETLDLSGKPAQKYIDDLMSTKPSLVYFIRALEEEQTSTSILIC